MRPKWRRSLLAAAVFAPCLTASAGPFQFELIADQTTSSIGVGNVLLYVGTPSVRGGRVVFAAQENYRNAVMCHENGSLSALLYYDAPITGTTTPAQLQLHNMGMDLWWPSVSPAGVAFSSRDLWGTGLYSIPSVGGPACLMHSSQQVPIPGGTGTFQSMGIVSLDGGDLLFRSLQSGAPGGLYRYSGSQVTRIADGATVIPETTYTAVSFGSYPAVHAGTVVFSAANFSAGVRAIVAHGGAGLSLVARTMTPAPDGAGDFTGMGYPCVSSAGVSFVGSTAKGGTGIFTTIGGSLRKVMDANTAYPGGGGMRLVMPPVVPTSGIKCSYPLASSGDRIVFVANDSATSRTGLFVWRDGRTARVAESGEAPCGRIIDGFDIGPEAIDGRLLAFHAFVTWNWLRPGAVPRTPYPSQVILATLPESSAADGWRIYE